MLTAAHTFSTNTSFENVQALIIEADAQTLRALSNLMTELGIQYKRNTSGQHVARQADVVKPNLILLDVDLPEGDPFAICQALRQETALAGVPIVAIGEEKWAGQRAELEAQGFFSLIRKKPLPHREFSSYLAQILNGHPVWMD